MGHPLRCYLPEMVYEFTTRTIQERYLLTPRAGARERRAAAFLRHLRELRA